MGGGNAEAFYGLFQCCNVHGFGEMFVHAGFLRVNAVYLLNKGFYLLIRCHKGDGFVSTVFFGRFGLTAAGGQCCRCRSNAADLQKRAAGDLFHHINILSHIFGKQYCASAAAQCCLSDSYTSHRHIPQELRRLRPVRTGLCAEFP